MSFKVVSSSALLAVSLAIFGTGCGGDKSTADNSGIPVPPPPAQVDNASVGVPVAPPVTAPVAAPPTASQPASAAAPQTPAQDFNTFTDADGKKLNELQILESAVDTYLQTRFTVVQSENDQPRPALTNLDQLVEYKILPRLPKPPAGKQWVFNPESKAVTVQ